MKLLTTACTVLVGLLLPLMVHAGETAKPKADSPQKNLTSTQPIVEQRQVAGYLGRLATSAGEVGIDIAAGSTGTDENVTWQSATLRLQLSFLQRLRVGFELPFYFYEGAIGDERFVRGNLRLSASALAFRTEWMDLYAGLGVGFATFEDSKNREVIFPTDLRAGAISHQIAEPGLALGDVYTLDAFSAARFYWMGMTFGVKVDVGVLPADNIWWLEAHAEVGYTIYRGLGVYAIWHYIIDPMPDGDFMQRFLGVPLPRSRHANALGAQIVWGGDIGELGLSFYVPLGGDYDDVQSFWFGVSGRVWLP